VTTAESERQSIAYRRLATAVAGAHLVDATMPPQQVVEAVISIVRRHLDARAAATRRAGIHR
jgi:hypothetical protein